MVRKPKEEKESKKVDIEPSSEEYDYAYSSPHSCESLEYTGNLSVTKAQHLTVPLTEIARLISNSGFEDFITYPEGEAEGFHISKHWYFFGGASVWLADYGVYFYTTRVYFSPTGSKHHCTFSFVYAQLYDSDWNEVKGTLEVPQYDSAIPESPMPFPQLLPIPFNGEQGKKYLGPEDPRILTRRNPLGFEEPMVVFNMISEEHDRKRLLHAYFPFTETLIKFRVYGYEPLKREKNWTPFFDPAEPSDTHVRFIYNINPLEILLCDLESGWCKFVQGTARLTEDDVSAIDTLEDVKISEMRGGTTLWPLPAELQSQLPASRKLYIGFARAHLTKCGCGSSMYRPNLFILEENPETKKFAVLLNSAFLDFNIEITPWHADEDQPHCTDSNVLISNGISYWDVQEVKGKASFDDHLGLTLSSGDLNVQVIHILGLLNYIARIPRLLNEASMDGAMSNVVGCALRYSREYCRAYGELFENQDPEDLGFGRLWLRLGFGSATERDD
ncbi:glycosyltransferase family 91 protein [Babjeviella inositovora NRRL Y-12698]|uniref:Glycosyltransferase family 91 protein n=1 Tax=Babjeviella inositovora NRRL Y-12698 TaxID=984486 RepID=A0A1E3QW06_9ASCO|nr:glycosyltransferase family 91 protein [Babjeviella inositovora NRRL Y-12698]ODQ81272.1 glycosyltransferase family 91 protein [Babjeviella inositovora NRRL Y-12698]